LSFLTAAGLFFFGIGTVIVAVLLLVHDLRSARETVREFDGDETSKQLVDRIAYGFKPHPYRWGSGTSSPFEDRVFATFELTRIRTQDRVIRANVRVFVPLKLRKQIQDGRPESWSVADGDWSVPYVWEWDEGISPRIERVKPEYAAMNFLLQLRLPVARTEPLHTSPRVSMAALFDRYTIRLPQQIPFEQQIDLPLTSWSSSSYPNDWYACDFVVYPDVERPLGAKEQMLIAGAVVVGEDLANQRVSSFSDGETTAAWPIHVLVERDWPTVIYVYAMSLVPMGFALLIFHQLFLRKDTLPLGDSAATIVAAILSVLGIRQVLVPPAVEGLTRVDLILGLGLALVLCLAFSRYAIDQWRDEWRAPSPAE
jgi:hypothetical protein